MTLELKMLALSIVLGLVQIVLASHAASLQRGYVWTASSRDEAVPKLTGVAGRLERALHNFVETFPLFAAAVLTGCCHTQLDDRVGCSALFLGSCRLSRPVRSWDFSVALPCMERGDAWDCLDPSVSGLKPWADHGTEGCSGLHWRPFARDHSLARRVFPASIPAWGRACHRPGHPIGRGALFAAVALAVTVTSYFAGLYRISIALAAATVILLFGYRIAVMG
jgi:uncharacterized MAPEG superfamily protein